jgi:hypothetical protein
LAVIRATPSAGGLVYYAFNFGDMLMSHAPVQSTIDTPSRAFYREAMEVLNRAGVPFLVGGAFALLHQAGIDKSTKDFDIFVRPSDVHPLLTACSKAGYEAELIFSHWLAKIHFQDAFIDVIFSSGNGVAPVDDGWFEHARTRTVLGMEVQIAPAEETLWSKAFVMERERYDGADVAHIILTHGEQLDWQRLLDRFGAHWRVLFSHLILYGFIFPSERRQVPAWVLDTLMQRVQADIADANQPDPVCYGTLLSWSQYLGDVLGRNFRDARIRPYGNLSAEEVARWTSADKS